MNIKNIGTPNILLYVFVLYILSIPIFQAYSCNSKATLGWFLLFLISIFIVAKSKKITFTFVEILFLALFFLLNVYYIFINSTGAIYGKYTYIFLLALFLSKVIPKISSRELIRAISSIYIIVMVLLIAEYLFVLKFGNKFFIESLVCHVPGVVGYRNLSNYTLFSSLISTAGMNSILLGAQTASQISLTSLIWFYSFYKLTSYPVFYKIMIVISISFLILSPTITSSLMFLIMLLAFGLMRIKHNLIRLDQIYISVIIIAILSIGFITMIISRYGGIDPIMDELIMPQIFNLSFLSYKEILLGLRLDEVAGLFQVTEVAMIHHIVIFGIIGVSVFIAFVAYNISISSSFINNLDTDEKSLYIASVAIVVLFLLSNVHYQVMFQVGLMEIFSIHLACIISIATRNREALNS